MWLGREPRTICDDPIETELEGSPVGFFGKLRAWPLDPFVTLIDEIRQGFRSDSKLFVRIAPPILNSVMPVVSFRNIEDTPESLER